MAVSLANYRHVTQVIMRNEGFPSFALESRIRVEEAKVGKGGCWRMKNFDSPKNRSTIGASRQENEKPKTLAGSHWEAKVQI